MTVPSVAGPSSSLVIRKAIEPLWSGCAATNSSHGDHHRGDRGLHVGRAAAIQLAVAVGRHEGLRVPLVERAGGHHVGVAGEHEQRRARVPLARPQVGRRRSSRCVSQSKPSGDSSSIRRRWQPLSSGVTEESAISSSVSARVRDGVMCACARKAVGRRRRKSRRAACRRLSSTGRLMTDGTSSIRSSALALSTTAARRSSGSLRQVVPLRLTSTSQSSCSSQAATVARSRPCFLKSWKSKSWPLLGQPGARFFDRVAVGNAVEGCFHGRKAHAAPKSGGCR